MDDQDPSLAVQWRSLRQEMREALPYLLALCAIVLLLATATYQRNLVWRERGDLWLDICNKIYRQRYIDPETGQEAPRAARGRIYNNIGLYLYDKGRELMRVRVEWDYFRQEIAQCEQASDLPTAAQRLAQIRQRQRQLAAEMIELSQTIARHVPEEFADACRRQGVGDEKNQDWDPFIPAEMCLRKALYHAPTYYIAHLNLGLVYKLRAAQCRHILAKNRAYLQQAEELFRLAHGFLPSYGKALRYHSEVLAELGEYAEAAAIAERAARHHDPADGDQILRAILAHVIFCWLEAGNWENAWRWYREVYRVAEPDRVEFGRQVSILAGILKRAKQWREAEILLRDSRAIAEGEGRLAVEVMLVDVLCRAGKIEEARALANSLVVKVSGDVRAWQALARCHLVESEIPSAAAAIAKAQALAPGDARTLLLEADLLAREGKKEEAIAKLRLAVRRLPTEPDAWGMLARLCHERGLRAEAENAVKNAMRLAPRDDAWQELAGRISRPASE